MKSLAHARSSAKRYGGEPEDYAEIHEFIDSSKGHHADWRHRALFHNSYGPIIAERVFGRTITNSKGREVNVRGIVEDHILEDLGRIPSVTDWLRHMEIAPWMEKAQRRKREFIPFGDEA